ncbi:tRNA (adenosine(37)-N6)-dimethylallyltransferase MiaA [Flavobacterium sp. NKUCC04_CG]|uniref:tRNA (adenosine(37)-N6)-dimethylallyltransferase MiaA n=1 Tax=Flavobacterium sp. NKUCC04_CG TaxID=2842121 RepID=UPI001C5A87B9|nr:tRNA (adenosine(37)-N6)-dimethylallyltransferase MiaA [Flavobacterium sp. NKUCC04_CG]MBW3519075.1 tRNA (adenosine(37)-N6)-dimethylallyltransferase MiaA [Flavobacterium sp. NKUCC04_CG]
MSTSNNYLITIVGPTAIGKTALAIEIAQHYRCEIISCDSRQFYKEMSIGTAVPSTDELAAVPHHFIQDKSIEKPYTVGDFERDALEKLDELFAKNSIQVMVGGSGLFVNAVLNGLDEFPEVKPEIRDMLNAQFNDLGLEHLQNQLKELDPIHYTKVALQNPQRVIRALEVCISSGKPYSSFLNQKEGSRNFTPIVIGLEAEREFMYSRINLRVEQMMSHGLLEESKKLYPYKNLNALQTVGYRELFSYLDNEISLDFAVSEIQKNTRRFAKRQLTWFKRTQGIQWFNIQTPLVEILNHINQQQSPQI